MDIFDYFDWFERECERRSLSCDDVSFAALEGTNDLRGRVTGILRFDVAAEVTAYLKVDERVEIRDDVPHRIEYGYFLIIDRVEQWGEELDLSHDPPVHRHGRDHERLESLGVTFAQALDFAWNDVTEYIEGLDAEST